MNTKITDWGYCFCCGGQIPPERQWGKSGERPDGNCPGCVNPDGICGAFGPREQYTEYEKSNDDKAD